MRYLRLAAISAAILSFGLTLGAAPRQAEAGQACDAAGLPSPCAGSSDIKPNIKLGRPGNDGDFQVKTAGGAAGVKLDGQSGNVTNRFLNLANKSNGLVKAWALINADGTVASCWRCNKDTAVTTKPATGVYLVDFTPLSADVRGRPRSAVVDAHETGGGVIHLVGLNSDSGDFSRVAVGIKTDAGALVDAAFTLIIY